MTRYYYYKHYRTLRIARVTGVLILSFGLVIAGYVFLPVLLWQIYFMPKVTSSNITAPIPNKTILNSEVLGSLILQASDNISVDYMNAQNWFPNISSKSNNNPGVDAYSISVPKLGIQFAEVSTIDTNLAKHLVNYSGTAIPPQNGNAVIFGHSTLPQLFNPKDYKKIFATAHNLKTNDDVIAHINGVSYTYKVFNIRITDPQDSTVFMQNYDDSYITLVTCTPPGTVWKRLIIKARLQKI